MLDLIIILHICTSKFCDRRSYEIILQMVIMKLLKIQVIY